MFPRKHRGNEFIVYCFGSFQERYGIDDEAGELGPLVNVSAMYRSSTAPDACTSSGWRVGPGRESCSQDRALSTLGFREAAVYGPVSHVSLHIDRLGRLLWTSKKFWLL